MPEPTIRLTWPQIAWGLTVIALILTSWGDMRVHLARLETTLSSNAAQMTNMETRLEALEQRTYYQEYYAAPLPKKGK